MKPGHAAMLALVGWYLMLPPELNEPHRYDLDAPLNKWEIVGTFDKALDCQKAFSAELPFPDDWKGARLIDDFGLFPNDPVMVRVAQSREARAKCIASDDPRLAK
jgi:hypothetical protein